MSQSAKPPRETPAYMAMTPEQIARAQQAAPREAPKLPAMDAPMFEPQPWHPYAQAGLLALSLPILAPSLMWLWFSAKRWGRVSAFLFVVPALILTAACLSYPLWGAIMIVADIAMAVLFVWRYRQLDQGVMLGFSNIVAMAIIVGGAVFMLGSCMTLPTSRMASLAGEGRAVTTNVREIVEDGVARPKHVIVRGARADWSRCVYRTGDVFSRQAREAEETWAPLDGGHGRLWVAVAGAPAEPPAEIEGRLVESRAPQRAEIERLAVRDADTDAMRLGQLVVMMGIGAGEAKEKESLRWEWSWLMAIGLLVVGFGIARSIREA